MKRTLAFLLITAGTISLIPPQAALGLPELRWLSRYSIPGEVLLAMALLLLGHQILGGRQEL